MENSITFNVFFIEPFPYSHISIFAPRRIPKFRLVTMSRHLLTFSNMGIIYHLKKTRGSYLSQLNFGGPLKTSRV